MMQKWRFERSDLIEGLYVIDPFVSWDERGAFCKDYSKELFAQNGIDYDLAEVFYTISHKGVVRAMHFQREKQQPKLVRCVSGRVWDVVCDLRKNSSAFGKWQAFELSGENFRELLIPAGCAHGYLVLEHSVVSYKCAEKFYGEYDDGVMWNDPQLAIEWPLDRIDKVILAAKDEGLQSFAEFKTQYGGF